MKVLVACEESQAVTIELRKLGHEAYSCDIIECSGGHPEWHIRWDVIPLLNGNCSFLTSNGQMHRIEGKWDMIIAFPPCTDLAVSGARHFKAKQADGRQQRSVDFFMAFTQADCPRIAIENPIGIMSTDNDDKRMLFENCRLKARRVVNPIIDWTEDDVWNFLHSDNAPPCNPLYCEGWKRVGCIGCSMAGTKFREQEFLRYPRYKKLYINAFDKMLEVRKSRGKMDQAWRMGDTGVDVFNWWMEYDVLPGQVNLFEEEDYE